MIGSRWTGLLAALALTLASAAAPQTASSQGLEIRKVEAVYLDDLLPAPEGERRVACAWRYVTQKPWTRLPFNLKTPILNPVVACLAEVRTVSLVGE